MRDHLELFDGATNERDNIQVGAEVRVQSVIDHLLTSAILPLYLYLKFIRNNLRYGCE